jgi:hypothetical protein
VWYTLPHKGVPHSREHDRENKQKEIVVFLFPFFFLFFLSFCVLNGITGGQEIAIARGGQEER